MYFILDVLERHEGNELSDLKVNIPISSLCDILRFSTLRISDYVMRKENNVCYFGVLPMAMYTIRSNGALLGKQLFLI